jgi:hypothetical protein
MGSIRVLMPSNANNDSLVNKNATMNSTLNARSAKEAVIRRPGVPVTSIQTDFMCKRISHFTVNREVSLIGFGLYNGAYSGYNGHYGDQINVEISICEFKTGKTVYRAVTTLQSKNVPSVQRVFFKNPVVLKPGRLYEAMAYYDQFVPLYLKTDPFQSVQSIATHYGDLTIGFRQMLPKGSYQAECYPSEIPELIFA